MRLNYQTSDYNWYDFSVFRFFNGEFQKQFKTQGRPLISQEMSTGYPNGETGHPTRSYQLIHQNPFSLIGYEAYDWTDPASFLKVQSFITGELAEALRRTGDQLSGIMHFAYMTWFRQCYDSGNIKPWPTYYALKRALQPVLASAELWGRNLYAGEKLPLRIYVVNDDERGNDLTTTVLHWNISDPDGKELASGETDFPAVRDEHVTELASQMKIHAYIDDGKPEDRIKRIESMRGLTLLGVTEGAGKAIISTLCTGKAATDPVSGHLLVNMLNELSR